MKATRIKLTAAPSYGDFTAKISVTSDPCYFTDFEVEVTRIKDEWKVRGVHFYENSVRPDDLARGLGEAMRIAEKVRKALEKIWEEEYGKEA